VKIVIFGVEGQLGRDLQSALSEYNVVEMLFGDIDITDREGVRRAVAETAPDWIINSAAMTHVDNCETEEEGAYAVNAAGAGYIAEAACETGARLIHVSTDYVFDGAKSTPYTESDEPRPVNVYGSTKLAGELLVKEKCPRHYIVRTSGLYGSHKCWGKGTNFVETMLKLSRDHTQLKIVNDEVLTPTLAEDLAVHVRKIVENQPEFGVYHATNEGQCSWFDFATEIFLLTGTPISIEGISSSEWGALAKRPAYSVLENAALKAAGLNQFADWRDALKRYLARKNTHTDRPESA
jgi:dTDP-4-dehydrorhamnose reductase